jgi:2-keto-4-pentenoate hydratase/2-oxohepta-3-ene-1,7-dioic acid hydratase in catechol pathway
MRLVSFGPVGAEQPGILADDENIVPLAATLQVLGLPKLNMNAFLGLLPYLQDDVAKVVGMIRSRTPIDQVRLGPPVPHPEKVVVVGGNYQSHVEEASSVTGGRAPKVPILVFKPSNTVIGCHDPLVRPQETEQLDYETELCVVIGRGGHRIPRGDALAHVAGYTIANDVTARDVLMGEVEVSPLYMQLTRGKGFPTFTPLGPWILTRDEVPDPQDLRIECWVNGERRQDGSTSDMIITVAEIIENCSHAMVLSPGDVILTGTPSGVGGLMKPPRYLHDGDVVKMAISGLGTMETPIRDETRFVSDD